MADLGSAAGTASVFFALPKEPKLVDFVGFVGKEGVTLDLEADEVEDFENPPLKECVELAAMLENDKPSNVVTIIALNASGINLNDFN
ncbi:MAG: hypothetical protein H7240_11510 [Glaciimonas sp.]|nr:hypothetical protein [Glaciimonas sp.]